MCLHCCILVKLPILACCGRVFAFIKCAGGGSVAMPSVLTRRRGGDLNIHVALVVAYATFLAEDESPTVFATFGFGPLYVLSLA